MKEERNLSEISSTSAGWSSPMTIPTEKGDTRGDRHSQGTEGRAVSPIVFEVEDGSAPLSR